VKLFKGPDRPINNEAHRVEVLLGLSCVDYAFIFDEREPSPWVEKLKPDIHVKGGDYTMDQILEKDAVERNGGRIVLLKKFDSPSTTDMIKKIKGI
jgi:D-glycero-beta-D-manno-heptose 1-phosphate adenylyltransferase